MITQVTANQADLADHLTDARENHRREPATLPTSYWAMRALHNELHADDLTQDYIASHIRMWP